MVLCEALSEEVVPPSEVDDELDIVLDIEPDDVLARLLDPDTYSDADFAGAFEEVVITGGKLDWVGINTVLNNGLDVEVIAVASGPMVTGTLKMAQISAIAANVSAKGLSRRAQDPRVSVTDLAGQWHCRRLACNCSFFRCTCCSHRGMAIRCILCQLVVNYSRSLKMRSHLCEQPVPSTFAMQVSC